MDATLKFQKTDPSLAGMEAVPGYFQRDGVMYFLQNTDPSLAGMEAVPGYFQRDGRGTERSHQWMQHLSFRRQTPR